MRTTPQMDKLAMQYANKMAKNVSPRLHAKMWKHHYNDAIRLLKQRAISRQNTTANLFSHY